MNIRPLTDYEIAKSKTAKNTANVIIRLQQKELTKEIKKLRKEAHRMDYDRLIDQRESMKLITGMPVIITIGSDRMFANYETIKSLYKSFNRQWYHEAAIKESALIIRYRKNNGNKGAFTLYELPTYQTNLLSKLPVIEIGS